jgi:hypothetical protein
VPTTGEELVETEWAGFSFLVPDHNFTREWTDRFDHVQRQLDGSI